MLSLKKKPRVRHVLKVWTENGYECWLLSPKDFNRLYAGENVIEIDGKVRASLTFAGQDIIVYRA